MFANGSCGVAEDGVSGTSDQFDERAQSLCDMEVDVPKLRRKKEISWRQAPMEDDAQRMHCDVCAENVQPKLLRLATPRHVLDFNERIGLDILSLPHWDGLKIRKMFEHRVPRNSFPDDHTTVVGYDGSGPETKISRAGSDGHVIRKKWFLIQLVKSCTIFSWVCWN